MKTEDVKKIIETLPKGQLKYVLGMLKANNTVLLFVDSKEKLHFSYFVHKIFPAEKNESGSNSRKVYFVFEKMVETGVFDYDCFFKLVKERLEFIEVEQEKIEKQKKKKIFDLNLCCKVVFYYDSKYKNISKETKSIFKDIEIKYLNEEDLEKEKNRIAEEIFCDFFDFYDDFEYSFIEVDEFK